VIRGVLAGLATLVAVALLALAWQVHSWQSRLAADDLRFEMTPIARGLWRGPDGPGAGAAKSLLAVDDDVRFRKAEWEFVQVHVGARSYAQEAERLAAFGRAQSALEELSRSDPSAARRSRAANLLGILLWENAQSAQDNAPLLLRQSVGAFRRSIGASSRAQDAKYNLELLLTVLQPNSERRKDAPETAGDAGLRGAGLADPGRGY
jgi:hypothetical protein